MLLDFADEPDPAVATRRAAAALSAAKMPVDVIAAAESVLVQALPGAGIDRLGVRRALRRTAHGAPSGPAESVLRIPVHYDGPDLAEASAALGTAPQRLVDAHLGITWRVQFMGFAPGFGYLVPDPASHADDVALFADLGRRAQSRPQVPAGSVAVAAGYSAVYPRSSPGGWYLLGRTGVAMWDQDRNPPAVLHAGLAVRFMRAGPGSSAGPPARDGEAGGLS